MLNERTRLILEQLVEHKVISKNQLMTSVNCNRSQLEYTLEKINKRLKKDKIDILIVEAEVVTIPDNTRKYYLDILLESDIFKNYTLNSEEREKYIFLMLFYFHNEYLSVNHFLDALKIGKTTFIQDIKKANLLFAQENILINYSRERGYYLTGDEQVIRYKMMQFILQDVSDRKTRFLYRHFITETAKIDIDNYKYRISNLLNKYQLSLVENRLNEFVYIFIFLLPRLKDEEEMFYINYNFEIFFAMKEYLFANELLEEFSIKNRASSLYLCAWVLGLSVGNLNEDTKDRSIIYELVNRILTRFELLSGIQFRDRQAVLKQLYSHFRAMYYRLFFKLPIVNNLHEKIIKHYPELYNIVFETIKVVESLFESSIPVEEISFLTMHFESMIEKFDEEVVSQRVGLIVCPSGIGTSLIVYNELKSLFPEFIWLGPIESEKLASFKLSFDMIFTTAPNLELYSYNKPVYPVNPIMSPEERYILFHHVYAELGISNITIPKMSQIMEIIKRHSDIKNPMQLERDLSYYLYQPDNQQKRLLIEESNLDSETSNLAKIVCIDYIQLDVVASSWEEALYLAAMPLVDHKVVERRYIEKIIQLTKREGPYMLIFDDVALPHARPEDGVNKLGLGVTVLRNKVSIKNKTMKYIFTLAAVDQKQHLNAISELVNLFSDESFFTMLENASDAQQVYEWLKNTDKIYGID